MKKLISLLMVLFVLGLFSSSFAQTKTAKGKIEIGGDASVQMYSQSSDGHKIKSGTLFQLYPRVGYFVIPKLELEPTLIFESSSSKPEGGKTSTTTHFGGVFSVSYNFEGATNLVPFLFGGIGFLSNSITDEESLKTTLILPDIGAGIKYFITEKGVIRAELFYRRLSNAEGCKDLKQNNFGLRAGLSIFLK
jgi:outer membrane protein